VFDDFTFSFGDLVFSGFDIQVAAPYGIQSVTTLPVLPATLYPDGVVVYLTTDMKLYRVTLNGTVWDRSADGADIAPNSITTNQILAGTILASDIATATLTAASGVFAVAAIESANIAELNVNTINVANGAITNIGSAQVGIIGVKTPFAGTGNGDFPITGTRAKTYITIASVPITIDSFASEIIVQGSFDVNVFNGVTPSGGGSEFVGCRILRDGFRIWEGLYEIGQSSLLGGAFNAPFAITRGSVAVVDGNISGAHTYKLQIFGQTNGIDAQTEFYYFQNTLVVTEVKK
jgi:hypothetical protein